MTSHELEKKLFLRSLGEMAERLGRDPRLERLWKLIERDFADPELNLEVAQRESGVSRNHLNVLLRRTSGFTFHQLLTRYRLLRALELMKNKNENLLGIALDCGFGSLSAFERNWRTLLGASPEHLRNNHWW